ncbi:hypothetical protein [Cupriavidus campinensis]|uniref:Uncharacterized protein n=1 Tax=Cupriavidus campinensis TaxID=151783 RepID=A0ABY3ESV9_9BURK|nr:hypothetical protein [Cupriavidus campinensis]TSP14032.1 hypothetical protein FGG12_06060 [Cupriavidus campinensis]
MLTAAQYAQAHTLQTQFREDKNYERREALHNQLDRLLDPLLAAAETADRPVIEGWIEKLPLGYHRATLRVTVYTRWPPTPTVYPKEAAEPAPKIVRIQPKPAAPRASEPETFSDGLAAAINSVL